MQQARVAALRQAKITEMLNANNVMAQLKKRYEAVVEETGAMQQKVAFSLALKNISVFAFINGG